MEKDFRVESFIDKEERIKLYKIIYIGVSAYSRLLESNRELVKGPSFKEVKTRLLNFVIKRQFEDDVLALDFPYKVEFKDVNTFGNIALFLKDGNTKIQINKTSKANKLYNSTKPSGYMLKEARLNSISFKEIKLYIDADDEVKAKEDNRIFMILGYGIKNNKVDHLDFIIPDENIKKALDTFNGMQEYNELISGVTNDEITERKIVALKEEASRVIK